MISLQKENYINPIAFSYPMHTKEQLVNHWREVHFDENILTAFLLIPREEFISADLQHYAYADQPLPTLRKQSISQPTTIALMLQALQIKPGEKVFEVGAGVGYQAALIGTMIGPSGKLITTEVIPELVFAAQENLKRLNLSNVIVIEADGSEGAPAEAPFDKIIITAACPMIPQPLIDQLKENGIIIAPVGDLESQTMVKGIKNQGRLELEFLGPFAFVPLKGKYGFKEVEMYYG